ncbi:hypothetical protein [Natrinema longum]|nr:hypothetical protein [Natrinema longum]MBZ6496023.1 hypothetical protein [Natrinema longum]
MVSLLQRIAENTSDIEGGDGTESSESREDTHNHYYDGQVRPMGPQQYIVSETSNLEDVNDDGSVTLEPGDEKTVVSQSLPRSSQQALALLAIGATDETDVQWALQIDDHTVGGGWTNSPLGLVNDPFSFVDEFQAIIPAEHKIEYVARYNPAASGSVDLVGRMHTEVI